jgi:hypothetical protein
VGVEEKANGDGAVVRVTVVEHLTKTEHAVVGAQVLLAAEVFCLAVRAVGGEEGLEGVGLRDQRRFLARFSPVSRAGHDENGRVQNTSPHGSPPGEE